MPVRLLRPDGDPLVAELDQLADGGLAVGDAVAGLLEDGEYLLRHPLGPLLGELLGGELERAEEPALLPRRVGVVHGPRAGPFADALQCLTGPVTGVGRAGRL